MNDDKQLLGNSLLFKEGYKEGYEKAQKEFHISKCPLCTHNIENARRETKEEVRKEDLRIFRKWLKKMKVYYFKDELKELEQAILEENPK